ncbi:MAG: glycoside hydrolase family 5 protein [Verrucomicrobia bacterium]|nr:glycoside hydrolase family 5 protein [Verrucomicrobiota bacterium]
MDTTFWVTVLRLLSSALAGILLCSCSVHVAEKAEKKKEKEPVSRKIIAGYENLPLLHTSGTTFEDDNEMPVVFKGCNLGNWLLIETWMLDMRGIGDQYEFEQILMQRFGAKETRRLMDVYRASWITDRDWEIIKTFGFNVVRLPFHYSLIEDDAAPMQLRADAFKWLDYAVDTAERHGLYIILDLHGAPGGQSVDHTTGRKGQNRLWTDKDCQDRTVWLWEQIARRYRGRSCVAAYDLINEPYGDYRTDVHDEVLCALVDRIYKAVRSIDPDHIIVIPGARSGLTLYGNPADRGWRNFAFTEHYYPGLFGEEPNKESHGRFVCQFLPWRKACLDEVNAPLLAGEFNSVYGHVGGPDLMRYYFDRYGEYGWAATMWCYKRVTKNVSTHENSWSMVLNAGPMPPANLRTSSKADIESLFRWYGQTDYLVHESLRAALTSSVPGQVDLATFPPVYSRAPAGDALPGWSLHDVGGALPGGMVAHGEQAVDVYGAGADIWSDYDQFGYVCRKVSGEFQMRAEITSLDDTHPFAKAGLMIRNSLAPDAACFLLHVFPNGKVVAAWRDKKGAGMLSKEFVEEQFPVSLAIRREEGSIVLGWKGGDGEAHVFKRAAATQLSGEAYVGFALLSHDNRWLTKATFADISLHE